MDSKEELTPTPEPTPKEPKPTIQLSQKTLKIFGGVFFLLLAIVIGGILYLTTKKDTPASSSNSASTNQTKQDSSAKVEKNKTPALKTGIKTDRSDFEVQLDSIESSANSVTVNFSILCIAGQSTQSPTDCYTGYLWDKKTSLDTTYLVDDSAQQKYEVIKDANGNPLVSNTDTSRSEWIAYGEKMSFFVTLTKPPLNSSVTLYIPNVQPIPGITITK